LISQANNNSLLLITSNRRWIAPLFIYILLIVECINASAQVRTIDDYIGSARRYNTSLIDYRNQFAALGFDSAKIANSYLPKINFSSQVMIAPVIGGFGYDSAITNGGNYSALVAASQELFQGGNRDLQIAKLRAQRQSIATTLILNERELIKGITTQYVTTYSDLNALQTAQENLKLIDEQLQILKELVSKGVYSQMDYLNLMISRNQQSIAVLQAQSQYRADLYKLNLQSGIQDTANVLLGAPSLSVNPALSSTQSLRIAQFTYDSLSIEYDRSLLDWTYRPKLGWFADAGLNTSDPRNAYHNLGFSAGLNLSIPLYDGGQRSFEYQKFDLQQNTLAAKARIFTFERNSNRMMLTGQMELQDSLIGEYRKQLESINELLQFQKQQLRQGNLKINDLLITYNTLNTTRSALRQAEIARSQSVIELNYINQ
jgi:outer membrane protein TolC